MIMHNSLYNLNIHPTTFNSFPESGFQRLVNEMGARDVCVSKFADSFPVTMLSEESLTDLNSRLPDKEAKMRPNRFRPNVVIKGAPFPFAEDRFADFSIGGLEAVVQMPVSRCKIPTVVMEMGKFGTDEPTATLLKYRKGDMLGQVCFSSNGSGLRNFLPSHWLYE